jgi:hypothetical protein
MVHSRTAVSGKIGRITPSGQFSLFPTPTVMSLPQVIVMGPDGTSGSLKRTSASDASPPARN